ncbi:MAG: transglutaminase-like domain-containing protein, partial [Solirubrobacteraceae bacterium]
MSAGAPASRAFTVPSWRDADPSRVAAHDRTGVRLLTFAALAAYGVQRWSELISPTPTWRLFGVLAIAVGIVGLVGPLARLSRPLGVVAAFWLIALAFPVCGLPWDWFHHARIAVGADWIGGGLQGLPTALVPYLGPDAAVRAVIVLGAAVLALDAAVVLAFAGGHGRPGPPGDGRRAAAALPLTALAIVPSTLIRPELPYLQGLLLFVLLAAFLWADRVRGDAAAAAVVIVAVAGVLGAIAAPRIERGHALVNYRSWAASGTHVHVERFDWNQTYGPLRWPRAGHDVLSVQARTPEYWKAQDLDYFDGYAWISGTTPGQTAPPPSLPRPDPHSIAKWTQTIHVRILGLRTSDVIAAGVAAQPQQVRAGIAQGTDRDTWAAQPPLGPGSTYAVSVYTPQPTARELRHAARPYPVTLLGDYLTLGIPANPTAGDRSSEQVLFQPFHHRGHPWVVQTGSLDANRLLQGSPYAGAYHLARRLEAHARTPYDFVAAVQRYVADAAYNEDPPRAGWPLETFLFSRREGYCQQFSGAMAMLLRMGGIPARVAAGFTPGRLDSSTGRWIATDRDAHAWVEVWFPDYGWVRFDPTPATAPARADSGASPLVKGSIAGPGQIAAARRHGLGATGAVAGGGSTRRPGGGSSQVWVLWLVLAAIALTAVAWPLVRLIRAGGHGVDRLAELEAAWARTGRPLEASVTLASLEHRLATAPEAAAYVRSLRLWRYGAGAPGRAGPTASQRRA